MTRLDGRGSRPGADPLHLVAAVFQRRSDVDAASAALEALAGSLGISLRLSARSTGAPGAIPLVVGGVSNRMRGAVRGVITRHRGQVAIDVSEAELRRR